MGEKPNHVKVGLVSNDLEHGQARCQGRRSGYYGVHKADHGLDVSFQRPIFKKRKFYHHEFQRMRSKYKLRSYSENGSYT